MHVRPTLLLKGVRRKSAVKDEINFERGSFVATIRVLRAEIEIALSDREPRHFQGL
jgi:hypothetical protein